MLLILDRMLVRRPCHTSVPVHPREWFRNGRPPNWGEGEIEIHGHDDDDDDGIQRFSRVAPVHPHTQLPLGEGCRWEREALDNLDCTVMAFFMP